MVFKDVKISDRDILRRFLQCQRTVLTDMTFGSIFAWRKVYNTQYAVTGDVLVLKAQNKGKRFYQLTYNGDFVGAIEKLKAYEKGTLNIIGINADNLGLVKAKIPEAKFTYNRDFSDYIYYRHALESFSGKKYQSKRNHINAFIRQYGKPVIEPVCKSNICDVLVCQQRWCREHAGEDISGEDSAVKSVLNNWDAVGMQGVALRIGGQICAYAIGEIANRNTAVEHFEKGLMGIENSYTVITNAFARSLPRNIDFINREEDMGLEGLRKAKLSLNPCRLDHKYMMII